MSPSNLSLWLLELLGSVLGREELHGAKAKGIGWDVWQVLLLRGKNLEAPPVMLSR